VGRENAARPRPAAVIRVGSDLCSHAIIGLGTQSCAPDVAFGRDARHRVQFTFALAERARAQFVPPSVEYQTVSTGAPLAASELITHGGAVHVCSAQGTGEVLRAKGPEGRALDGRKSEPNWPHRRC